VTPLVSVCVTTYRHQGFIAAALDSVLAQRTDFAFEVLVGEDGSDDATPEIVRRYERADPRVRAFFRDRADVVHYGGRPTGRHNFAATLAEARGRYVALLDGDDTWSDPDKLALKVARLEREPESSLSFHPVAVIDDRNTRLGTVAPRHARSRYQVSDLALWLEIPTSSVLLRRSLMPALGPWFLALPFGDWPLFVLTARHGPIAYVDREMSVYRRHPGARWSTLDWDTRSNEHVVAARAMLRRATPDLRLLLEQRIAHLQGRIIQRQLGAREGARVATTLSRALTECREDERSSLRWAWSILSRVGGRLMAGPRHDAMRYR
jgi:glycosyltransferase involved in cell wall biosynthesis